MAGKGGPVGFIAKHTNHCILRSYSISKGEGTGVFVINYLSITGCGLTIWYVHSMDQICSHYEKKVFGQRLTVFHSKWLLGAEVSAEKVG